MDAEIGTGADRDGVERAGGCHCGAVRLAARLPPLPAAEVTEDHCSVCIRNALTMHYFPRADLQLFTADGQAPVAERDHPQLAKYSFGIKTNEHRFCRVCGVQVEIGTPPEEAWDWDGWSEYDRKRVLDKKDEIGVVVRCLNGVEWEGGVVGAPGKEGGDSVYVVRRRGDWGEPYVVA